MDISGRKIIYPARLKDNDFKRECKIFMPFSEGAGPNAFNIATQHHGRLDDYVSNGGLWGNEFSTAKAFATGKTFKIDQVHTKNAVVFGSIPDFAPRTKSFTVMARFLPTTSGAFVFALLRNFGLSVHGLTFSMSTGGANNFNAWDAVGNKIAVNNPGAPSWPDTMINVWSDVTMTFDNPAGQMAVWQNKKFVSFETNTTGTPAGMDVSSNDVMTIGNKWNNGTLGGDTQWFNGLIDWVGFWHRKLSDGEIAALSTDVRCAIEVDRNVFRAYSFAEGAVGVPDPPTNGAANSTSASVNNVTWTNSAGATSYNLYWDTSPGITTGSNQITGLNTPYDHTGLNGGVTYYYKVSAVNGAGESGLSSEFSELTIPDAPLNVVSVGAGTNNIEVTWDDSTGATSYNIYWDTSSGITTGDNQIAGETSPYLHTGRDLNTTYYYAITAVNASGESVVSVEVSASTLEKFELPFEITDAQLVGGWRADSWDFDKGANFTFREPKSRLRSNLPRQTYQVGTLDADNFIYPNLSGDTVGRPVPFGFGRVTGAPALQVDVITKEFRVVGHSITTFDGFRANGVDFTPDSSDLTDSSFKWSSYDGEAVEVDFTSGVGNPVDTIEDLFTDNTKGLGLDDATLYTPGSADEQGIGFGADGARTKYIRGINNDGDEVSLFAISLFVNESTDSNTVLDLVTKASFSTLGMNLEGQYVVRAWEPIVSEGVLEIVEDDDFGFTKIGEAGDPITEFFVNYRKNYTQGSFQSKTATSAEYQHRRGLPNHKTLIVELPLYDAKDVRLWMGRALIMLGRPLSLYRLKTGAAPFLKQPGESIRVKYELTGSNRTFDALYEILEITKIPGSFRVELILTDWRGFKDRPGFWKEASASPDWGDVSWADDKEARENSGFWLNDDQLNSTDEVASWKASVWV